jgi:hypothetical protein
MTLISDLYLISDMTLSAMNMIRNQYTSSLKKKTGK